MMLNFTPLSHGLFGPVYMDENCRQYAGTNPLCTRLHGDPANCRLEMQIYFSYPLSTRNFGGKKGSVSNSPMMHCARDSFIQDSCCFGLLALYIDNRINNIPHKHLGRPKRIGYNCPGFGSLQVPIFNENYIPFSGLPVHASTSTKLINTPHLRLPENIRELNRAKNRFRKLWNNTRYPPYKREVNALIRQIRSEIQEHKNRTWKDFLLTLNPEDNSLYNLHRKFSKRHIPFPPLHGPGGMAYSDFEKAEAFKDTLEVTFQENEEPYCDDKIEEIENLVDDYFDNFATCTPPLTSPSEHSTVITCLFADDSAVLSQGVQLKYTIKTVQHFLDKLETWLTHWRIAINVDKSQAIVFRKWGVIDPPFQLTLFDDNIQWVSVVKYLGLHIDSRLTFKKHIDYLSEKFWGRISLAISLIGRRSPLSLENKVILYKQILRPVITYGSPVWGAAAATHMKKIQVMQNKILRVITNAPWYI
ncbi:RNA-directed DNA polymerase from mobile element jockey [Trichonephila clavipes]|nr:RNA-directed DNA polymerase from mobile element jockey [Trichonephila clavipes]